MTVCCQQTCMTYTIAVCTVKNSWWWTEELSETCRMLFQKLEKLVHLVGFTIRNYHYARSPERQIQVFYFVLRVRLIQFDVVFYCPWSQCLVSPVCLHVKRYHVEQLWSYMSKPLPQNFFTPSSSSSSSSSSFFGRHFSLQHISVQLVYEICTVQPLSLSCERMLANTHSYAQSPYKTTIYWTPAGQYIYIYIYIYVYIWLYGTIIFGAVHFFFSFFEMPLMMTTCPH